VVERGSAEQVLQHPAHSYTRRLLASRPTPDKKGRPLGDETTGFPTDSASVSLVSGAELLVVKNLVKQYGRKGVLSGGAPFRALDDVSFTIHKGETLGLAGESGCGKSTLSRVLMGLIPATSGEIWFSGLNLLHPAQKPGREIHKEVQLVFQDPYSALNPSMTIGQAIEEPIALYGLRDPGSARRARVAELLGQVGLGEEHIHRYPHEFSGGQRQRIVIARALAVEPSLLICDESVSALDVSVQAQVLNLLNRLKRELSLTYLFISHDLNVVYYMSDRIMVMRAGRIEEAGPAEDVFFRPKSAYTRTLLASMPGRR
jgi:peptide/nickel transport system ATP-binding protein